MEKTKFPFEEKDVERIKNDVTTPFEELLKNINRDYCLDYGSVVLAIGAIAASAVKRANNMPFGGITGYQASFVMWEMVRHLTMKDGPARLLCFEDMLFPQYEEKFKPTISKDTHEWLVSQAKSKLAEASKSGTSVHPTVEAHWKEIVDGKVPFNYSVRSEDV
jgi:hypothetical protein